jgi:hypothetical protein
MASFHFRCPIGLFLAIILPASLAADDSGGAILRSSGNVQLNRTTAPPSSAIFPNDLVETQAKALARIELPGTTVDINPGTVVEFENDEMVLEHGSLSVNTTRDFKVRVGCVLVTPVISDWTQYDVTDSEGKVRVAARKKDVNIDSRPSRVRAAKQPSTSDRVSVHEGEQKSREENCGAPVPQSGPIAAAGALLNSPLAVGAGLGAIGALTCWVLCRGRDPVSPSNFNGK